MSNQRPPLSSLSPNIFFDAFDEVCLLRAMDQLPLHYKRIEQQKTEADMRTLSFASCANSLMESTDLEAYATGSSQQAKGHNLKQIVARTG